MKSPAVKTASFYVLLFSRYLLKAGVSFKNLEEPSFPSKFRWSHRPVGDDHSAMGFAEHSDGESSCWHFGCQISGISGTDARHTFSEWHKCVNKLEYKLGRLSPNFQKGLGSQLLKPEAALNLYRGPWKVLKRKSSFLTNCARVSSVAFEEWVVPVPPNVVEVACHSLLEGLAYVEGFTPFRRLLHNQGQPE